MPDWLRGAMLRRGVGAAIDLAVESWWKLSTAEERPPSELTWKVDPDMVARLAVVWPRRYQWPYADKWVSHIREGLSAFVALRMDDVEQPYPGVVIARIQNGGDSFDVAIDYSDYSVVSDACAGRVAVYFKMQFSDHGYRWNHVVPGGFVPAGALIYRALPHLRKSVRQGRRRYDVYGRFGRQFATQIRADAVARLTAQRRFHYEGGLAMVRYSRHLTDVARAGVCIDLPGNGDLCFRLIDYLAIGSCVIGPKPRSVLHAPLVDRQHVVYAKDDLSDLVDLCEYYLAAEDERVRIARNSAAFFDKYLNKYQLASYYLSRMAMFA